MSRFSRIASLTFTIGLFLSSGLKANAGHVSSNEITYRWIDTLTYEVDFVFYRSCAGVTFNNPTSAAFAVCQTSGSKVNMSLKLVSIKELQTLCDTLGPNCSGKNKTRSGDGVEVQVYRDTVDFRMAKYANLIKSGCNDIRFEVGLCCRNSSQTTGAANKNLFNYAVLSLKDGGRNSSPEFALPPIPNFLCNQPVFYSVGTIDTLDGDSLSYAIVQPKSAINSTITTSVPPFTSYYPGTLKYPYNNPNSIPPIGFHFNNETGQLIFTPTKCDEHTTMVFEIREWRKDAYGKYQNIGLVRRDMMYSVVLGKRNNPPVLTSARHYSVCEGASLCVNLTTQDQVKVPPPPQPKPDPDTTKISWNRGIPDGTFSVINDTALNQIGRFCWAPKEGAARSLPYQFDIKIKDNNCPVNAISYYAIQILVKPRAKAIVTVDSLGCGLYAVTSNIDSAKTNNPRYHWTVMDMQGNLVTGKKAPVFESSQSILSLENKDTIQFKTKGTYIIRHIIDNREKCPTESYDTLVIGDLLEVLISDQMDTFVCQGTSKTLEARLKNESGKVRYAWSSADSTQTISYVLPDSVQLDTLSIVVSDATGCKASDEVQVINRPRPVIDPISNQEICVGDSIKIKPTGNLAFWNDPRDKDTTIFEQGSRLKFILIEQGKSGVLDTTFTIRKATAYQVITTDSLACADTTNFLLTHPALKISFQGFQDLCWDEGIVDLKSMSQVTPNDGIWKAIDSSGFASATGINSALSGDTLNGDTLNTLLTPRPVEGSSERYLMRYYHDRSGCATFRDTMLAIRGLPEPKIDRKLLSKHSSAEPFTFCKDDVDIQLSANYNGGFYYSQQPTALDRSIFKPSESASLDNVFEISYLYADIYGCQGGDTVQVVVNKLNDKLNVSPQDTALSWYSDNMVQWVLAAPKFGRGVKWEALDGGSLDNNSALTTRYRYTTDKEVTTKLKVRGSADESGNACPASTNEIGILVHRTPCIDFNMDVDLSAKTLKLTPTIDSLASYQWTVKDSTKFDVVSTFNVAAISDTLINVRLQTHNKGGDNCYTDKVINLKNGSIKAVDLREIVLYPNPVNSGFSILMKKEGSINDIRLYNSIGSEVSNFMTDENYVDCSNLSSGIYSVVFTIDNEVYVTKFVKIDD